jgi:hypothetical protein
MIWIKLLMILTGIAMIGSALVFLAIFWPVILIVYGLVIGGLLLQWATEM